MANTKITVANMAANSIDSDQYVDGSIDTAHIADGQITVGKMAANSVDSAQYVDGSIDTAHYADNSITGAELADNIVIAGTLGSTGKITADAGIDIDNFNIDGTTIALSSGDLTLDVAGDMIIDVDGGDIYLNDGGTGRGQISMANTDLTIISATSDRDLIFKGVDGASVITALTLDMSDAGAATFNAGVTATGLSITSNTPVINIIESDQSNKQYQIGSFGSAYAINDASASQFRYVLDTNGNHIFNEGGVDADFRVESDGNANMLFVDGGNNRVGIGTNAPTDPLTIHDGTPSIAFKDTSSNGEAFWQLDGVEMKFFNKSTGGDMVFGTANNTRWKMLAAGHLVPNNQHAYDIGGTNAEVRNIYAQGISFASTSNAGGMSSELLDDYETGGYDAAITCASGTISLYSTYNRLVYTKIGHMVHVQGQLAIQSVSSPTGATTVNLPFAIPNLTDAAGVATQHSYAYFNGSALTNGTYSVYVEMVEGTDYARLYVHNATGSGLGTVNIGDNYSATGTDIRLNLVYYV